MCQGSGALDAVSRRKTSAITYSLEEVRKHNTPKSAWIAVRGRVYDVSSWHDHPGGDVVFTAAGEDATEVFAAFHPPSSFKLLERFYIGELEGGLEREGHTPADAAGDADIVADFQRLRFQLRKLGLFEASFPYYVWKVSSNLMLLGLAVALLAVSSSFWVHMLSACVLALFYQQCGWLAHDFLHHQVFKNRFYGDLMGFFIGNVCQGFSVAWWKNKHNTHHAIPNLNESGKDKHDGDPDIDTMPFLAWSLNMAKKAEDSGLGRFMLLHQSSLYFPILLIARISWLYQSFLYVQKIDTAWNQVGSEETVQKRPIRHQTLERVSISLYYLWNVALMVSFLSPLEAVAYFIVSQCGCGLLLALVFGVGHNGMSVYERETKPDFFTLQITTTRNVTSSVFVDWFMGGLQYQVEHHLFPMVPRHHLGQVNVLVKSLCKKHGLKYHETGFFEGNWEVLSHLSAVTKEFVEHFPAM